jgi:hypothetical protein
MEKKNIKGLILILASDDCELSIEHRKIYQKYMFLNQNFKFIFIYGKLFGKLNDINYDHDIIYDDIEESYPVRIYKTLRAFQDIIKEYKFDFLIRTNLSTFWNLDNLDKYLDTLPKINCYCGHALYVPPHFVNQNSIDYYPYLINYCSGTSIILSYDLILQINNNNNKIKNIVEDVTIGDFLNKQSNISIIHNEMCILDDLNTYENKINEKKIYYRVKTNENRLQNDIFIYTKLLKIIYNIEF